MRGGYCGRASSPIGLSGWPTGACAISVAAGGEFDEGDQQLQQQAERDPRPHRPPPVAEAAGVPVVTGISPSSGLPEGGTTVTLTGSGFTGASAVHFGSTSGVNAVVVRDTQLTVISPPGTGVVDVTVTGAGGTSSTAAADSFAYGAPVVTGITPADGPPTGGTVVTVSGDNLTGATAVNFGSTLGLNLVMISNTQLTVVSPPGTGVVDLTITGVGGTSSTSAADRFSYAPIVTAIAPNSGDPSGGTTVTVSGSNFTGFTSVNFGNAPGLSPTVSGTRLTVVSPPGTGVVHLTVTGPGGISATTPADFFAYGEPVVSRSLTRRRATHGWNGSHGHRQQSERGHSGELWQHPWLEPHRGERYAAQRDLAAWHRQGGRHCQGSGWHLDEIPQRQVLVRPDGEGDLADKRPSGRRDNRDHCRFRLHGSQRRELW